MREGEEEQGGGEEMGSISPTDPPVTCLLSHPPADHSTHLIHKKVKQCVLRQELGAGNRSTARSILTECRLSSIGVVGTPTLSHTLSVLLLHLVLALI